MFLLNYLRPFFFKVIEEIEENEIEQTKSMNILRLSLKSDLVKVGSHVVDHLFSTSTSYNEDDYFQLLELALTENKPKFFKILIDEFRSNATFLKDFLISKRLYFLYNFKNEVNFF